MATISEANALIKWFDKRRGKTLKLNDQGIDVVVKALDTYCRIPEIIKELEGLKMSMEGQIFYNQPSKLIYEERMESTNETVDETISIVKQLLVN